MKSFPLILPLFIFAATAGASAARAASAEALPADYQTHIVELYSEGRCSDVRKITTRVDLTKLRPNVMAIAAYCKPPGWNPEILFAKAEALSPTGDLIALLHAKYRSKTSPATAEPLWQRVLLIARNDYFRKLAKDHLAGVSADDDRDKPLNLSSTTGFARISVVGLHASNAQLPDFVYLPTASSNGVSPSGDFIYRRWYRFGSLAAHYSVLYDHYFSAPQYNYWDNNLEFPVAMHVATNKDLVLRPFTGYSNIGASPYRFLYGLGVAGTVYRDYYKQSVQGIVYNDRVLVGAISSQQGAHYRFEYSWDFFPQYWLLESMLAVEHVSATPASTLFGYNGFFEMSHTDIITNFKIEHEISRFTLGFAPRLLLRVDSQASQYPRPSDGAGMTKQRHDFDVDLQWTASMQLVASLQLFAWYEWRHIFSNIDAADYVNRNYSNETVGLGIRTSLSTY